MDPSRTPRRRALVVGAGVGGLAAATSLHRAGWEVVVCERAPARRTGGYFVRLAAPGLDAADRLGVAAALPTRLPAEGVITGVDGRGRTMYRVDASLSEGLSEEARSRALVRGDLERALWAALPDAVEVRFGTGPRSIREDPVDPTVDDAVVRVGLGAPEAPTEEDFDLVVGADGVRSTVRDLVFGPEERFRREFDHVVVSAVLPRLPGDLVEGDYVVLVEPGRTAHLMAVSGHAPLVFFTYRRDRAPDPPPGDTLAALRAVYGDFAGLMPEILAGVEEAGTTHVDTVGQIHLERWSRGRVVLLGDAAWCPTLYSGYGSALALAGGEALGRHLAGRPDDVPGALAAWERDQRPTTDGARAAARRARHFFLPGNRLVAGIRTLVLRLLSLEPVANLLRRAAAARHSGAAPVRASVHPTATSASRPGAGGPS